MTNDNAISNLAMWYIDHSFVPTSVLSPTSPGLQLSTDICGYFAAVTNCSCKTLTDMVVILIDSHHSTTNKQRTTAFLFVYPPFNGE